MPRKIIPHDESIDFEHWEAPLVWEGEDGEEVQVTSSAGMPQLPTAEEIEEIQRQAHEEAFAKGREEGFAQGLEEGRPQGHEEGLVAGREAGLEEAKQVLAEKVSQLDAVYNTLAEPLAELDEQVEEQLVALALAVARQVVRREIRLDPGQVIAAVRESVSVLPMAARDIRVHLHPEDAALVREAMSVGGEEGEQRRWTIVEDAALTRGGCRVETDTSRIDHTVESRLGAAIAKALGGDREGDSPTSASS